MAQAGESESLGQLERDVRTLIVRLHGETLSGPEAKMLKKAFASVALAARTYPERLAPDLCAFARDAAEPEMRAMALSALCKTALENTAHRKDIVSAIAEGLKDENADVRFSAALALRALGENDIDTDFIVSMIVQQDGVRSKYKDMHDEAVISIGAIAATSEERAKSIYTALALPLLPSYHYTTRMKAADELSAIGLQYESLAGDVLALLTMALQDEQAFVCYRAVEGAAAIGRKYESCKDRAVKILELGLAKPDITFAEKNKIEDALNHLQKKDAAPTVKTPEELAREKRRAEEAAKEAQAREDAKIRESVRQARLRDIEKRAQKIAAAVAPR